MNAEFLNHQQYPYIKSDNFNHEERLKARVALTQKNYKIWFVWKLVPKVQGTTHSVGTTIAVGFVGSLPNLVSTAAVTSLRHYNMFFVEIHFP